MSSQVAHERDAAELLGSVLAGRYRVERLLGEGGMGRVYLAEHILMRKPVALKVLHPEMTAIPDVVARFEREAVAAARIDHPNVAQAMDFGHLGDGSLYFVLEYVDGRSLRALLDEGPLGVDRVLAIARQIAVALVAAHEVGIVHRDLKPDNVMLVSQSDGTDRVKVLDFGIAKVSGDAEAAVPGKTLTRVGVVMGTAGYMAPEQALGQAVSHLADMYAFGSMLYEMLAGHLPFDAAEVTQILSKQLTEEPPPLPAGTPSELEQLTQKLLARTASERVASAAELTESIERIIQRRSFGGAPTAFIAAAPVEAASASGRLAVSHTTSGSPAKRRPAWVAGGVLALVGLGTFAALRSSAGDAATPSSAPSASAPAPIAAPSEAAGAPERVVVLPERTVSPERAPAAPAEPARAAPSERASSESRATEVTSTERGETRTKRTKHTRVTEEHTVKRTRRRTGPGGIYIPPPSEWFK